MKGYTKRIISAVLSLAIVLGATSFTKFSNVNAQATPPATPQEPSVLNEENANLEINDLAGLKAFRDKVNSGTTYEGQTVNLNADIDMSTIDNWNAIGTDANPFKGTFEGRNHKISNLKIDKGNLDYQGLFGYIDGATIQDLGLENTNVKGRSFVGSLVGYSDGTGAIKNSYAAGSVTGTANYVGGLIGWIISETIENSYATGNVNGAGSLGGLVGANYMGTIKNSYGAGNVSGEFGAGGLVGRNYGTTINSYVIGKVSGTRYAGGLVGINNTGEIKNSYAIASVDGSSCIGGLVGYDGGKIITSYYNKDMAGQGDTGKGIPLSTVQMAGDNAKANMTGFDFSSTWGVKATEGIKSYYPYLKNFGDISAPYIELK